MFLVLTSLFGCASSEKIQERQLALAVQERPLVKLECPEYGCVFKSFQVNNPNQVNIPKTTNGWDAVTHVATAVLNTVDRTGTMYLVTEAMKEGYKYSRSIDNSVTTTNTTEGSNNVTESSSVSTEGSNNSESSSIADSYNTSSESVVTSTDTMTTEDNSVQTTTSTSTVTTTTTDTNTEYSNSYNVTQ